jgi:hypothetical protein
MLTAGVRVQLVAKKPADIADLYFAALSVAKADILQRRGTSDHFRSFIVTKYFAEQDPDNVWVIDAQKEMEIAALAAEKKAARTYSVAGMPRVKRESAQIDAFKKARREASARRAQRREREAGGEGPREGVSKPAARGAGRIRSRRRGVARKSGGRV